MTNTTTETKPLLTTRQRNILTFLQQRVVQNGVPPTVREIGARFGIKSPNGVMCHLKALEKKGVINRDQHLSRGIRLTINPYHVLTEQCQVLVKLGHNDPTLSDNFRAQLEEIGFSVRKIEELS